MMKDGFLFFWEPSAPANHLPTFPTPIGMPVLSKRHSLVVGELGDVDLFNVDAQPRAVGNVDETVLEF